MMSWTYSTHARVSPTSPASMGSTTGRDGRNGRSEDGLELQPVTAAVVDPSAAAAFRPLLLAGSEDLSCCC